MTGQMYQCMTRWGIHKTNLNEHGQGNAPKITLLYTLSM